MEAAREKVAVYFEPDQSVITKITKDAKMTWSDKISWVSRSKYHLNTLEEWGNSDLEHLSSVKQESW